jgi:hypothetical protein
MFTAFELHIQFTSTHRVKKRIMLAGGVHVSLIGQRFEIKKFRGFRRRLHSGVGRINDYEDRVIIYFLPS